MTLLERIGAWLLGALAIAGGILGALLFADRRGHARGRSEAEAAQAKKSAEAMAEVAKQEAADVVREKQRVALQEAHFEEIDKSFIEDERKEPPSTAAEAEAIAKIRIEAAIEAALKDEGRYK